MSTKNKNVLHAWKEYENEEPVAWSASFHCLEFVYRCSNGDTITFFFEINNKIPFDYVRTGNE